MPVKRRRRLSASYGYAYGERAASVRSMRRLSAACGYAYGVCAADTYRMMQHTQRRRSSNGVPTCARAFRSRRSRFPLASLAFSARVVRAHVMRSRRPREWLVSMMLSVL